MLIALHVHDTSEAWNSNDVYCENIVEVHRYRTRFFAEADCRLTSALQSKQLERASNQTPKELSNARLWDV